MISYAIMAHPSRSRFIPHLKRILPDPELVWDRINSRWDTGRRSMLAFNPEAEWHIVVQDDALPCRGFHEQAEQALSEVPSGPVAFYMGKTGRFPEGRVPDLMRKAQRTGARFVVADGPRWGPAVAVRTDEIPAMIQWCDTHSDIENYDRRMESYFRTHRRKCYYTAPCLVNHRTGRQNPSLVEGRGHSANRSAAWWSPHGSAYWARKAAQCMEVTHG